MGQPILAVEHLQVCYTGKPVLEDVSLTIEPGQILGIVGESGSGKSTLIKAAMGLLDSDGAVAGGRILYKDQDITALRGEELRRLRGPQMGMIFQNTGASLCPIRTIQDQLFEAVLQHEKISRQEIRERAMELFDKMKLADGDRILKSYPFELSGGMNQRVGIMIAMILQPSLLFGDEPTSALDVTVQAQVVREMMKMRELFGTTIVIVTHNIGVVEYMADKVAVMHRGRLVEYGDTKEVMHHPQKEYTRRLISAVLRIHRG